MNPEQNDGNAQTTGISADEVALYDRQIRLWGMAAQERMRNAHVLIISIKALANEVAKNLVLAGVGAVTLLDCQQVTESDLGAQFLVSDSDVGRNRAEAAAENARKLNPRVMVHVDHADVKTKPAEYFGQFHIVVACDLDLGELIRINDACRASRRPFYAAEIPGMTGYIFADLIEHDFVVEREETKPNGERQKITVPQKETYKRLEEVLLHDYGKTLRPKQRKKVSPFLPLSIGLLRYRQWKGEFPSPGDYEYQSLLSRTVSDFGLPNDLCGEETVRLFLAGCDCELSALAAIVGGVLSQDVLNVLSGRETPIQNFFVYDGQTCDGPIYKL